MEKNVGNAKKTENLVEIKSKKKNRFFQFFLKKI
jgi:hypothetical protein